MLSTPIGPFQNRSFREGYGSAGFQIWRGRPRRSITEQFSYQILAYQINGAPIFDPDNPPSFFFADRRKDREPLSWRALQGSVRGVILAPMRFEKIWVKQCRATKGIKRRFGAMSALDYLIRRKTDHVCR